MHLKGNVLLSPKLEDVREKLPTDSFFVTGSVVAAKG